MGQAANIFDLAEQMIQLAGFTPGVDIPIQITGLRPGEKMHESLVGSQEKVVSTGHFKLMAVCGSSPTLEAFSKVVTLLSKPTTSQLSTEQLWILAQDCVASLEPSMSTSLIDS